LDLLLGQIAVRSGIIDGLPPKWNANSRASMQIFGLATVEANPLLILRLLCYFPLKSSINEEALVLTTDKASMTTHFIGTVSL